MHFRNCVDFVVFFFCSTLSWPERERRNLFFYSLHSSSMLFTKSSSLGVIVIVSKMHFWTRYTLFQKVISGTILFCSISLQLYFFFRMWKRKIVLVRYMKRWRGVPKGYTDLRNKGVLKKKKEMQIASASQ